jgi:hypothetical protein
MGREVGSVKTRDLTQDLLGGKPTCSDDHIMSSDRLGIDVTDCAKYIAVG